MNPDPRNPGDPRNGNHPVVPLFRLTLEIGSDTYTVTPLRCDPAFAWKAFRLRKQPDNHPCYDVSLSERGCRCSCPCFRYRGKCKHLSVLKAARLLE
jgi:hypothetical protein